MDDPRTIARIGDKTQSGIACEACSEPFDTCTASVLDRGEACCMYCRTTDTHEVIDITDDIVEDQPDLPVYALSPADAAEYDRLRRSDPDVVRGLAEGRRLAEEGAQRTADAQAPLKPFWMPIILMVCKTKTLFTNDDVMALGKSMGAEMPKNGKVFGNWLKAAEKEGWCRSTTAHRSSSRGTNHGSLQTVWLSEFAGLDYRPCEHCHELGIVTFPKGTR